LIEEIAIGQENRQEACRKGTGMKLLINNTEKGKESAIPTNL
jgi:hypothetical protein